MCGQLFDWIVQRINAVGVGSHDEAGMAAHRFIGVLDIFGFEIFQTNSFEQVCACCMCMCMCLSPSTPPLAYTHTHTHCTCHMHMHMHAHTPLTSPLERDLSL